MKKSKIISVFLLSFMLVSVLAYTDYEINSIWEVWMNLGNMLTTLIASGVLTLFILLFLQTLSLVRGKRITQKSSLDSESRSDQRRA